MWIEFVSAFVWWGACFQTPWVWSPVCRVAWSDQWWGIGLHTGRIRRSMTLKLIHVVEREPANLTPDSPFSYRPLCLCLWGELVQSMNMNRWHWQCRTWEEKRKEGWGAVFSCYFQYFCETFKCANICAFVLNRSRFYLARCLEH